MRAFFGSLAVLTLALAGCTSTEIDVVAEEEAVRRADAEIVAAINAHDIDEWLSFYTEDAKMLPPGAPPVVGKDAIRDLANMFASAGVAVSHNLEEVVVSRGGDLAYVSYSYEIAYTGPDGTPLTETGKDITIYKKTADGLWKQAIDMWSDNGTTSPSTS